MGSFAYEAVGPPVAVAVGWHDVFTAHVLAKRFSGLPSNWFDFRSPRVSECGGPCRFLFVGESRNVYPFQRSLLEIPVVSSSHACTNRIFVGVSYRTFPCILAGRRCWGRDPATPRISGSLESHQPPPPPNLGSGMLPEPLLLGFRGISLRWRAPLGGARARTNKRAT